MHNCIIVTGYIMKVNELRIGNLVYDEQNRCYEIESIITDRIKNTIQLNLIDESGCGIENAVNVTPIPLTEEWLEKLGFKKGFKDNWYHKESNEYFNFLRPLSKCSTCHVESGNFDDIDGIPIKYVHQLQNLYFALTGEELTIK